VKEVKRKVLVIAVALMAVTMLVTPMVGTAQAFRPRRPLTFEATFELRNPATFPYPGDFNPPTSTEYFGPTDHAWEGPANPEGHKYQLMKGYAIWGTADCGPLGIGKLTMTQNYWLNNLETMRGIISLIYHLEFDGDYGDYEGTLTGNSFGIIWRVGEIWYTKEMVMFLEGTGDFNNVKMTANVNWYVDFAEGPLQYIYYGKMLCTAWGLP
jgi:hypothetical protein